MVTNIDEEPQKLGIFSDIDEKTYHSSPGISKHGLDLINQSGAHYKANNVTETKALIYGGAFHMLVLEPFKFGRNYTVNTKFKDFRTNKAKEWKEEMANEGIRVISQTDFDHMQRMRDAILAHKYASVMLDPKNGHAEQSVYWMDDDPDDWGNEWSGQPPTGQLCRCRPDFYNHKYKVIADLKTTVCAGEHAFARQCANYRYHVQDAFYSWGLQKSDMEVKAFVFVAIEKVPPYAIGVYKLDVDAQVLGGLIYRKNLRTYADFKKSKQWPGYPPYMRSISLPKYAEFLDEY